ncbi:MAG: helix-turn-helix domain-containing protein [Candidatus Coproplasma sp.]
MIDVTFSENLKQLMKENQVSQMKLSREIGVAQSAISAWLAKKKEPSINSLWLIADYFDVTVDFLIGRKDY